MIPQPPLLAITERRLSAIPLPARAEALFAAGVRWLSLRDKDLGDGERLTLARSLVAQARRWGATVTVHGDPVVARAAGAAGVHLPDGADVAAARALLGPGALVGVSAHGRDGLAAATAGGADYATLSPVFASSSKPGYGPVLGLDGLREAVAGAGLPVVALGGVDGTNAGAVLDAGAAGVAVMGLAMRGDHGLARLLTAVRAGVSADRR